ncbi:unnamed protein product, partial [Meganyctiphanes norvegica]
VHWFLESEELHHNVSIGIIQSNQSLVLQHVMRSSSGRYTCMASNSMGTATSESEHLMVKYAPVCSKGQRTLYGGGKHQPVNVTCQVDAHPPAAVFNWAFNTSTEMYDIAESKYKS